jgi:hypothetical protein
MYLVLYIRRAGIRAERKVQSESLEISKFYSMLGSATPNETKARFLSEPSLHVARRHCIAGIGGLRNYFNC